MNDYMQQYSPRGFRVLPPVIKNLLILNGLFFLATYVFINQFSIDLTEKLGLHYFGSSLFRPYQLVTYMFMHGGMAHIFFNMFALWMFGNVLEEIWGGKKFLFFYFVCGIGAALTQMLVQYFDIHSIESSLAAAGVDVSIIRHADISNINQIIQELTFKYNINPAILASLYQKINVPTIGASGAVYGILLAFGMTFPNALLYVYFLFPIKAKWFVIIYAGLELYAAINSNPSDNVAHYAHLGGIVFGFILIKIWNRNKYNRFY